MYGFDLSIQEGHSEKGNDHMIVEAEKSQDLLSRVPRTKGIMV